MRALGPGLIAALAACGSGVRVDWQSSAIASGQPFAETWDSCVSAALPADGSTATIASALGAVTP